VHERRVQQRRQASRELQSARIPGNVALQFAVGQTQPFQGGRDPVRGVIAHQYEGSAAVRVIQGYGLTVEPIRKFLHGGKILPRLR
jgi:hypothetical protein